MIKIHCYSMVFVFAQKRGVYAMLGVNVWLHNIHRTSHLYFAWQLIKEHVHPK